MVKDISKMLKIRITLVSGILKDNHIKTSKRRRDQGKKIYQYDLHGDFINQHRSVMECRRKSFVSETTINRILMKNYPTVVKFLFYTEPQSKDDVSMDINQLKNNKKIKLLTTDESSFNIHQKYYIKNIKSIYQYDLKGTLLHIHDNAKKCMCYNNISRHVLLSRLKGNHPLESTYILSGVELEKNDINQINKTHPNKIIHQYRYDYKLIQKWINRKELRSYLNLSSLNGLTQKLRNGPTDYKSFLWSYKIIHQSIHFE